MEFSLDDSLGFILNCAASKMRKSLEDYLLPYQLTPPQWGVLMRLSEFGPLTPSELASRLFFDRPTIAGIILRLEKKKIIHRQKNVEDSRSHRLILTAEGKKLISRLPNFALEVNRDASRGFSHVDLKKIKQALLKIIHNIDEV